MSKQNTTKFIRLLALAGMAFALAAAPSFGQTTYDLCASDGTVTVGGAVIPIWGFADITGGGSCTTGLATLPGPVLTAADGDVLTINVSNALGVGVSIFVPGLPKDATDPLAPETTTDGQGRQRLTSLDKTVAPGGSASFSWTAEEGTYLYQSGTDIRTQVPMGLYGALVVSGTGYPEVAEEQVLVFSEIDPALNANPAGFGGARVSTWDPKYFLINGESYDPLASTPLSITVNQDVLLRLVNAGLDTFVPTFNRGLYMNVIAEDGNLYPYALKQYGVELQAAKTIDAVINVDSESTYTLYDLALHLVDGGMIVKFNGAPAVAAPVAVDDSYSLAEDGSISTIAGDLTFPGVLDNDTGAAVAVLVNGPSSGVLAGGLAADGSFTYTPHADFAGADQFTYRANDGAGGPNSNVATVTITVIPVNDVPVVAADAYEAIEGQVLSIAAPGVLGNDTDVDGDALTAAAVGVAPPGVLALNANGSFGYTPAGTAGAVETFDYQACDPSLACSTATVTITVVAPPANVAPTAVDDTASTPRNTPLVAFSIVANDEDSDGTIDPTTVVITTGALTSAGGTVVNNGDGTITYTPKNSGYRGTDTFQYTVKDNDGATSNVATVRINVTR